jgi:protein NrfD
MIDAPTSTWFTASPHWHWLIVTYFVLGALAGGTYFLSALIDLTRRRDDDRRLARLGYYITLPLLLVVGVVLIVDLARSDRFWHLLIENHTLRPMFKWWVPMSTGAWAILLFGFFALLTFVAAFAEHRRLDWRFARRLRPPGLVGMLVVVPGMLLALYVSGYTGVMLSVLNRPVWSDTPLWGPLFVVSAVTMSAALLVLGARFLRWRSPAVTSLHRIVMWLLVVQILVLGAVLVSLGGAARGWLNAWGLVLAIGIVLPLIILAVLRERRPSDRPSERAGRLGLPTAAALVLAGGVMMRMAIVFVPEAITP